MDPQLVILESWLAGPLDERGGSLGLGPSTHVHLDLMGTVTAWHPSMGSQDSF